MKKDGASQAIAGQDSNIGKLYENIDRAMVKRINGGTISYLRDPNRQRNCVHCTLSYILDSVFGKHVIAKGCSGIDEKSGMVLGGRDTNIFKAIFDGIKYNDYRKNPILLNDVVKNLPNGSTGILHIGSPSGKIGHVINWEKTLDGKVSIIDPQLGKVFKSMSDYTARIIRGNKMVAFRAFDFTSATIKSGVEEILDNMVEII